MLWRKGLRTNASGDGAYYSLEVFNRSGGSNRPMVGLIDGGAPETIASGLDANLVGWTATQVSQVTPLEQSLCYRVAVVLLVERLVSSQSGRRSQRPFL